MQKSLTISVDERLYEGLHTKVGRGHISRFIEELVRPRIFSQDTQADYKQMAQDESRESEALVGRGHISQFIEELVRPRIFSQDVQADYKQMAQDESRESEALEWAEVTIGDVRDEPR